MMSVKYCLCGPLNLHLPSLYFCYFLMFVVSFSILQVIDKKLWFFYVESQRSMSSGTIEKIFRRHLGSIFYFRADFN